MTKSYERVKFFLFTNSYSGRKISIYLRGKFGGKKLIKVIERLCVIFEFKYKQTADFIVSGLIPISPYQRLPNSLRIYLEIENELSKLSEEKLDEYSTALEDYQKQLLYPAIERAVGNSLNGVDDDSEFQELLGEKFRSAIHIYYKVARKYGLPTMRNIPFILSIIS